MKKCKEKGPGLLIRFASERERERSESEARAKRSEKDFSLAPIFFERANLPFRSLKKLGAK